MLILGTRPNLLITDAFSALSGQSRRKKSDTDLLACILNVLRLGGDVLLAIDTAGRVLELAQLLDQVHFYNFAFVLILVGCAFFILVVA